MKRAITILLSITLVSCSADHRARNLIAQYKAAVEKHDIPALVKLSDPNMRANIDRGNLRQDDVLTCLDAIMQHPLRVVTDQRGIVYLGWVPERNGTWLTLTQVVVGEGRSISKYSALRDSPGPDDTTDWQVSVMGKDEWAFVGTEAVQRANYEERLAKLDEQLLKTWYFEGSYDAKHEIDRVLNSR